MAAWRKAHGDHVPPFASPCEDIGRLVAQRVPSAPRASSTDPRDERGIRSRQRPCDILEGEHTTRIGTAAAARTTTRTASRRDRCRCDDTQHLRPRVARQRRDHTERDGVCAPCGPCGVPRSPPVSVGAGESSALIALRPGVTEETVRRATRRTVPIRAPRARSTGPPRRRRTDGPLTPLGPSQAPRPDNNGNRSSRRRRAPARQPRNA